MRSHSVCSRGIIIEQVFQQEFSSGRATPGFQYAQDFIVIGAKESGVLYQFFKHTFSLAFSERLSTLCNE